MLTLTFSNIEQLPDVARRLLDEFPDERFFAFFGPMGVGKTTLIKELCAQLGVTQNVCSPTFAIVNEYSDAQGEPIYHFDFYRIKKLEEAYDIGYEEYFYSGYYCFTEWTEKIEPLLPDHYLRIDIAEQQGTRTLTAEVREQ
jgi:tRNA threonylcarbamoyladenosine biosynthesis protein TsaE